MTRDRIVAIGECMVELAPAEQGLLRLGFAGDTFNTAWYLRQLLGPGSVDYLTAIGSDASSDQMLEFIAGEGIGTGHIRRVTGRSVGLYLIRLKAGERSFSYWRSTSAARLLAEDAAVLDRALSGARLAYLSGITLAVLEGRGRERLLDALRRARNAGVTVAFDPNIRPALWEDATVMRDTVMRAAAGADIVLPSFDDEATHFGDADPQATGLRYAASGAGLVVVKDGARPVLTLKGGREEVHRVPPVDIAPVDTTAAGDSFNAGFLAAMLRGAALGDAVAEGAALAGRVIAAPGALVRGAVPVGRGGGTGGP